MKNKVSDTILVMKDFNYMKGVSLMNKAFIALSFGQSLSDLPPLVCRIPLTAFYCLVKATLYFIVIKNTLPVFSSNKINGTL